MGATRSTIPRPTSSKNAATCVHENVRPAEGNRCWPPIASSVEAVGVSPAAPPYRRGARHRRGSQRPVKGRPCKQALLPTSSLSSCSQRRSGLCPGSGPAAWWDTEELRGATRPRSPPQAGLTLTCLAAFMAPTWRSSWAVGTVQKLGPWSEKGGVGNTMSPRGGGAGGRRHLGRPES